LILKFQKWKQDVLKALINKSFSQLKKISENKLIQLVMVLMQVRVGL